MSDIWDEDFEEKMNDHYRKTAMTDKPQRDEHITRMLDQLNGGVGTFLQGDGQKARRLCVGLESERLDIVAFCRSIWPSSQDDSGGDDHAVIDAFMRERESK